MPPAQATQAPPVHGAQPLFAAAELTRADRQTTTRHHLPAIVLMESAGAGAAAHILARYPHRAATIVCGAGNNGGDGYVVARHLLDAGWDVQIAVPHGLAARTDDARTMAAAARSLGLRPRSLTRSALTPDRIVIDALLGIGITGAPRDPVAGAIAAINASGAPVVALDIPTGVDADTGAVAGQAVRADLTVTFHADKVGLHVHPGRAHAGEVVVQPIGIPRSVRSRPSAWLIDDDAAPAPRKGDDSSKYTAGPVLVVAGSPGLTGAGVLASRATLRAGGGLTVAAIPAALQPLVAEQMVEVMCAPIPDQDGVFTGASVDAVLAQAARVGALALGPGLGRDPRTTPFVRAVLEQVDLPAVIDADGLWHLGRRPTWLKRRQAPVVITPHSGEAARLLGTARTDIDAARLASARELARAVAGTAVLKGPGALIVTGRSTCIDAIGTAALATAGSGDVLTGIIAAMLAKGLDPHQATVTAVAIHSRAGIAADRGDGTIAGDLIEALPQVIAE